MRVRTIEYGKTKSIDEIKEFVNFWLTWQSYDDGELEWIKHSLERTANAVGILSQILLENKMLSEEDLLEITQCYWDIEIIDEP